MLTPGDLVQIRRAWTWHDPDRWLRGLVVRAVRDREGLYVVEPFHARWYVLDRWKAYHGARFVLARQRMNTPILEWVRDVGL